MDEPVDLPARRSEQILVDAVPEVEGNRIVCTTQGRAQFAALLAQERPEASVVCMFLDMYRAEQARSLHEPFVSNLKIVCEPDLPESEVDAAAFPFTAGGEAELTRELMQQGHQVLRRGGRMFVTTNNPKDTWLHQEMRKVFDKVTYRPERKGVLYIGTKTGQLKKPKNFEAEFAFRDGERLLRAVSRPGVFAHRRIDPGARALIRTMVVREGDRVVDMGCGSGVVSLAAASRAEGVRVLAIDSNPRAVQCTAKGAELNGLTNITTKLEAEGRVEAPAAYDLFLANPPYFSHFRIAEVFVSSAEAALKPGGRVYFVTKTPDWYEKRLPERFLDVTIEGVKDYFVATGRKR